MERQSGMALKFKSTAKDEIGAQLQSRHVERDGAWVQEVEGATDKGKFEEFRANNLARIHKEAQAWSSSACASRILFSCAGPSIRGF
jgi:hypothetical protein